MCAVIINKKDRKELYNQKLQKIKLKGISAYKYCERIKLIEDPLLIQRKMRDEWD